jgi:uncharacterized protein (TIGR02147 family)
MLMQKSKALKKSLSPQNAVSLSVALLKSDFFKKQSKNPNYSMRAFAKKLGVSHTVLSLIFSGKRRLSQQLAHQIVDKLDFTFKQRKLFLAEHSHHNSEQAEQFDQVQQMDLDKFALLSEWQHYAILSLLETTDFKMDEVWIAKRLGISELMVKNAIERLVRLELLAKDSKGKWHQKNGYIRFDNKTSTAATKHFHKQLIKKAYESLENDPFDIREQSSMTFAMNPKDLPYAIERIKEFRYKLSQELENMSPQKEVYNLCVQLYPVSRREKE